jgi:hypothetical protein
VHASIQISPWRLFTYVQIAGSDPSPYPLVTRAAPRAMLTSQRAKQRRLFTGLDHKCSLQPLRIGTRVAYSNRLEVNHVC